MTETEGRVAPEGSIPTQMKKSLELISKPSKKKKKYKQNTRKNKHI
jgi:hypothetical protein